MVIFASCGRMAQESAPVVKGGEYIFLVNRFMVLMEQQLSDRLSKF